MITPSYREVCEHLGSSREAQMKIITYMLEGIVPPNCPADWDWDDIWRQHYSPQIAQNILTFSLIHAINNLASVIHEKGVHRLPPLPMPKGYNS